MASEASPQWGGGWKALSVLPRMPRYVDFTDLTRSSWKTTLEVAKSVSDEENDCRFEGQNTVYTCDVHDHY